MKQETPFHRTPPATVFTEVTGRRKAELFLNVGEMSSLATHNWRKEATPGILEVVAALTLLMFLGASESAATICIQPRIEVERVQGIVLDEREEDILPGATLTLRREGRLLERVEFSDHDGFFTFQGVPEGDYTLRIELAGFSSHEGRVRVRKGANLGQVLVASLPALFEGCGHLEMTSARKARQMQQEILGRRGGIHLEQRNEDDKPPQSLQGPGITTAEPRPLAQNPTAGAGGCAAAQQQSR